MVNKVDKQWLKITGFTLLIVLAMLSFFAMDKQKIGLTGAAPVWFGETQFDTSGEFRLNLTEHFQAGNITLTFYTSEVENLNISVIGSELVVIPAVGFNGETEITLYASDGVDMVEQKIRLRVKQQKFSVGPPPAVINETQIEPVVNETLPEIPFNETDKLLKKDGKFIGKRLGKGKAKFYFSLIEKTDKKLILEFRHDSKKKEKIELRSQVNYTLNQSELEPNETARLEIDLIQGIIPKFELSQSDETIEIGKAIPKISTDADYTLIDRDDEKLDVQITSLDGQALIKGINVTSIETQIGPTLDIQITSSIIAAAPFALEEAVITLAKTGQVNVIMECSQIDLASLTCLGTWQKTAIPFTDNGTHITFTVDHFSGYGGAQLEIINVQSFPEVNGNWTVEFTTTGTANLTISAIDNTTWTNVADEGYDLKFLELKCGENILSYTWLNNSAFYPDYSCNETGSETSKVLTAGKHTLEFKFGDDLDYAHNLASANLSCQVRQTSCNAGEVPVMHMSDTTNAHAEQVSGTDYNYLVCCKDLQGRNNLTNSSGTNIVNLSSATDAHAETPGATDYAYGVFLNATPDNVSCSYDSVTGSCTGNKTCLFTMSGTTDAHVADCTTDPYTLTVCCGFQINNRGPDTSQVILNSSSGTNYTNEDLKCYANATDVDNDNLTVSYKWYNNSVEFLSGSYSPLVPGTLTLVATLGHGNTTKGETWTCSVRMNDGTIDETDWNNATLTVRNSAPAHSTPMAAAHQPTGTTVDANLISYWQFEAGSNKNNKAIDALNRNNGTLNGPTFTDDGRIGSAYSFDGVNDEITFGTSSSLEIDGDELTITMWCKNDCLVWKKANDYSSLGYALNVVPNYPGLPLIDCYPTNGYERISNLNVIKDGNWHFYACVIDENIAAGANRVKIYQDGVIPTVTTECTACTVNSTTQIMRFGHRNGTDLNAYINGTMDEVQIYNRSLSASEIMQIYLDGYINQSSTVTTHQDLGASSNSTSDTDNDNVVRIYNWFRNGQSLAVLNLPFESNLSSTAAGAIRDYSGYGSNATLGGGTAANAPTWTSSGRNGSTGAYVFDGVNDIITNSSAVTASLDVEDAGTISAWIKPSTNNTNAIIAGRVGNTGNWYDGRMALYTRSSGTIGFNIANGTVSNPQITTASNYYAKDTWYHVVGTFNGTNYWLYVNGAQITTNTYSIKPEMTGTPLKIGYWNGLGYFNGTIDEVHIYNHALSPEQILAEYNLEYNRLVEQETTKGDVWYAEITPNDLATNTDGPTYKTNNVTINDSLPSAPTLLLPLNNASIINPSPTFVWSNAVDPDSDTLTYQVLVDDSSSFDAPEINISSLVENTTNTSYTPVIELTLDKVYYWKVRANDSSGYGDYSTVFNFTLQSQLSISLIRNVVNFSQMYMNNSDDTSDNNPLPFLVENTGNLFANITITGTPLFELGGFPSIYYMFKIDLNETGAFDFAQSTTSYTNMTNVSSAKNIVNLNWRDVNDTAEIDLNITVPLGESQGTKISNVTLRVI